MKHIWWLILLFLILTWFFSPFLRAEEFNIPDNGKAYDAVAVRFNAVTGERLSSAIVVKAGLTLSQCHRFLVDAGATTPINGEYVLVGCMERTDEKTT